MKGMSREEALKYLQDFLYVINGKWKLLILAAIHEGSNRFRDIQRSVPPITTRVLSKELKELEQNQLIVRTVYDDSPVSVVYTPTEYSRSLFPVIEEMVLWGKSHRKKLAKK
jgi:DNA-binding HxlR family transcriptional regulator